MAFFVAKTLRATSTSKYDARIVASLREFDGPIAGKRADIQIGRNESAGLLRIELREDGAFTFTKSMHDSARVRIATWPGLPAGPIKAAPCEVESHDNGVMILRLPVWP